MFGKKLVVSVVALTIGAGGAIAASTSRSGSLRINPMAQSVKAVSNPVVTTSASSRMATMPGASNISTKPKLPSSASAAAVADLKDKLNDLAADVAALQNAGVDENAVRDIIDYELSNKDYATRPELNAVDAAKYDIPVVDEKLAAIKPTAKIRYQESSGDIQYEDADGSWQTFANKTDFAGADGKSVVLQKTSTEIQWKPEGAPDSSWQRLVGLEEIKGDPGDVDEQILANVVNTALDAKDLPTKDDLNNYVDKVTYNADQTTVNGKITSAQSAAETAQSNAAEALQKVDDKLDKDVAFAKQTYEDGEYFVLLNTDTGNVISKLAKVDDLKGNDGAKPCESIVLEQDEALSDSTGDVYNLICIKP